MKTKTISAFLIIVLALSGCSNYYLKKGSVAYDNLQYQNAINYLQKGLVKTDDYMSRVKLARSYRMVNDTKGALAAYQQIVVNEKVFPEDLFSYGRMLMSNKEYDKAAKIFTDYLKIVEDDWVAEMLLASCNSVDKFYKDTLFYSVTPANINDEKGQLVSQFGTGKLQDGVVFTGERAEFKGRKVNPWTGNSYLDLYFTQKSYNGKWLNPVLLNGDINGQYHEGPAVFTKDGNTAYFTRSNYVKKKLKTDDKNVNNLKIFRAEFVNDKWTNLKELPFNSDDYSCGHPALSPDEKVLYFVSDMPGTNGGADIFKINIGTTDGTWGKPENLGNVINTKANEMFPYVHNDGSLYFSSEAHDNLGGLDVFVTSFVNGKWLTPENLNYPVNTSKDDFAFVMNDDNTTGYLSTNRSGVDNISEFKKNGPTFNLLTISRIKGSNMPLAGVNARIINLTQKTETTLISGNDGKTNLKLEQESEFLIKFEKENFLPYSERLSTKGEKISKNYTVYYNANELIIDKPIVLENIYYDFDKWFIRPDAAFSLNSVVEMLQKYPNMKIEMSSHTDSRASDQYNLVLSDKRAKAAVEYLVSKGIDKTRLTWKGYGETKLINNCKNDVPCTEEEHQLNRRTEFKILKK